MATTRSISKWYWWYQLPSHSSSVTAGSRTFQMSQVQLRDALPSTHPQPEALVTLAGWPVWPGGRSLWSGCSAVPSRDSREAAATPKATVQIPWEHFCQSHCLYSTKGFSPKTSGPNGG